MLRFILGAHSLGKKKKPPLSEEFLFVWGAIRESNPFMTGSQPVVFTVSPIAPRSNTI